VGFWAFLGALALGTAAALLMPEAGRQVSKFTLPEEQRKELEKPQVKEAISTAYRKKEEKAAKEGIVSQIVEWIPGSQLIPGERKEFETFVQKELKKKGYSEKKAKKVAQAAGHVEMFGAGVGEAAGILGVSTASEALGTKLFAKALPKAAAKAGGKAAGKAITTTITKKGVVAGVKTTTKALTKKQAAKAVTKAAIKAIAPAGAYEGATSYTIQQMARQKQIKPEEAAISAAFGAATATALGVPIARFAITRPAGSKILDIFGSIMDPYEKPGDIAAHRLMKAAGFKEPTIPIRATVPTAVVVQTTTQTQTKTTTAVPTQTKTQQKPTTVYYKTKKGWIAKTPSGMKSQVPTTPVKEILPGVYVPVPEGATILTPTNVYVPTQSKTPTETSVPTESKTPTETQTKTPTETKQPTETPPEVPTQPKVPTQTNVPTEEQVPTEVTINVPTETTIPTSIPVMTPIARFTPPLLGGAPPAGGAGYVRKGKMIYFNELAAAKKALMRLL